VSDEVLQRIDGSRAQAVLERDRPIEPAFLLERPPFDTWPYRMANPTAVGAVGPPVCRIVVGDPLDQALHLFDFDGKYEKSVAFGDPRSPEVLTISALGVDSETGNVEIFDVGRKKAVKVGLLDPGPPVTRPTVLPPFPPGVLGTAFLGEVLPDAAPGILGGFELSVPDDEDLSQALNEGAVVTFGDTLWFARFVDGRFFKFVKGSDHRPRLAQVVSIPVHFRIDRPEHVILDGVNKIPIQTQRHINAVFFHGQKAFTYLQTVTPYERWAIVTEDRLTGSAESFPVGRVRALTAISDLVITIESVDHAETWVNRREVVAYRIPGSEGTACHESLRN